MKSKTNLVAAMLATAMLVGSAKADGPQAPTTVAGAKALFEAYNSDRLVPRSPRYTLPPGNVPIEHLHKLLDGSVSVGRNVAFLKPIRDLQIVFTGRNGQVVTCREERWSDDTTRRWSWTAGRVRDRNGKVRPVVRWQARSPGLGEGPLSLLRQRPLPEGRGLRGGRPEGPC